MHTRQTSRQIELMPYEQWRALLQYLEVPAALSAHLIAVVPGQGVPTWPAHELSPRRRDLVHAALEQCKHPAWHRAVLDDPLLESLEPALTHLLAAPHLDVPRAGHQPADLIAQALAEEPGTALIAAALMHGRAEAITHLRGWLRRRDDARETQP